MKQLLIVKKGTALNGGISTNKDLSVLPAGAIAFLELDGTGVLSASPKHNFAIALGRANSPAFVIPEVDIDTLHISKSVPALGKKFTASITIPTVAPGKTYTLVLIKNGTAPHERNTWSATETIAAGDTTTAAANIAAKLRAYFTAMANSGSLEVVVSGTGAAVTITGKNYGDSWTLKAADDLSGTSITATPAEPTIGDAAYIQELASKCAAGKGFTDTYRDGDTLYPGYPEAVENLTPNTSGTDGVSTEGYAVFTLRFAVGRASAKTRDERVNQIVHIAVPISGNPYTAINGMLPEGDYLDNLVESV